VQRLWGHDAAGEGGVMYGIKALATVQQGWAFPRVCVVQA